MVSNHPHHQETAFHIVGPYLPFSEHFTPTMAYLYDPISRKLQYGGATIDIQEIAAAIYSIKNSLQENVGKAVGKFIRDGHCNYADSGPSLTVNFKLTMTSDGVNKVISGVILDDRRSAMSLSRGINHVQGF